MSISLRFSLALILCLIFATIDAQAYVPGGNPIPGATAEYPMMDGSGTNVTDISGHANTGVFSATPPVWTTYGLKVGSAAANSGNEYFQTPIKTWKTLIANVCTLTGTGGGTVAPASNLLFGGTTTDGLFLYLQPTFAPSTAVKNLFTYYPGIYAVASAAAKTSTLNPTKTCSNIAWVLDSTDHIYIDGTESAYTLHGASASSVTTTGPGYAIGSNGSASNFGQIFNGEINYVLFYPGVLTAAQIAQEDAYINAQVYSRAGYPGTFVPSTLTTPQLTCIGDSLTQGSHGSPWCNSTNMTLNNTYTFNQLGISGDEADSMVTEYPLTALPFVPTNGARSYCSVWLETNDIFNGFTPAQTWAKLQFIGRKLSSSGCIPIVSTMISRVGTGVDTAKNTLNTLIRTQWQSSFAAMNDIAANPVLGADGAYANPVGTCFFTDQTHLINTGTCYNGLAGYPTVGANLANLINSLDGSNITNPTLTASNAYTEAYADNYLVQTPTSAATNVLPDCTGLTGLRRTIVNGSASNTITVSSAASLTITGTATIPGNTIGTFTCELTGPTTGGNYWLRTQ